MKPVLTATANNRQVALTWTFDNTGGYTIDKWQYQQKIGKIGDNNLYGSWTDVAESDVSTRSHAVQDLTNGTEYTFKVRPVNVSGAGEASNEASATPKRFNPEKPLAPTLTAIGGDEEVTLNWTKRAGSVTISKWQYRLKSGNAWGSWTDIANSGDTTTTHTVGKSPDVTTLTNNTAYTFQMRGFNTDLDAGALSNVVVVTPLAAPSKPTGFSVDGGNEQAALTWDETDDTSEKGYKYQYKVWQGNTEPTATTAWKDISGSDHETTSHTLTGLSNGQSYKSRIRALNDATPSDGVGEASDAATFHTVPAKPTGFKATGGNAEATLRWANPNNSTITGWKYRKKEGANDYGNWTLIPSGSATTVTYKATSLNNGKTYKFQIRAVNGSGDGPASNEAAATMNPAAPANLTAEPGNALVALVWNAPDDPSITKYEYSKDDGTNWSEFCKTSTNSECPDTITYTATGLTNGTAYTFKIRVTNATGNAVSASATATPSDSLPPQPKGLTATATGTTVNLSWNAIAGIKKWQLWRSPGGNDVDGYCGQRRRHRKPRDYRTQNRNQLPLPSPRNRQSRRARPRFRRRARRHQACQAHRPDGDRRRQRGNPNLERSRLPLHRQVAVPAARDRRRLGGRPEQQGRHHNLHRHRTHQRQDLQVHRPRRQRRRLQRCVRRGKPSSYPPRPESRSSPSARSTNREPTTSP